MSAVDYDDCIFELRHPKGQYWFSVTVTHKPTGLKVHVEDYPNRSYAEHAAMHKLTEVLASPEQRAMVDAMSWSNANMSFEGADYRTDNMIDHDIAADILRGLEHLGWKLVALGSDSDAAT